MIEDYDLFQKRLKTNDLISKDKLVKGKISTFENALQRAYNRETAYNLRTTLQVPCFISDLTTATKIEKKSFSTLVRNNCAVGDILFWVKDKTHWMIVDRAESEGSILSDSLIADLDDQAVKDLDDTYLVALQEEEDGIFQGTIEQALYNIKWQDTETGVVYNQWVCLEHNDPKELENTTTDNISIDFQNDNIKILMPRYTDGIDILKRYKQLMINGEKWEIENFDDMTKRYLVSFYLSEKIVNEELDGDELAGEVSPQDFEITTALDGITSIQVNKSVDLSNIIVQKKGNFDLIDYTIEVRNCTNLNNVITFDKIGTAIIVIKNNNFIYKTFTVSVVAEKAAEVVYQIEGNDKIKTLTTSRYTLKKYEDGIEKDITGTITWNYDSALVSVVDTQSDYISLKAGSKIGSFTLKATINNITKEHTIKITPLFGG